MYINYCSITLALLKKNFYDQIKISYQSNNAFDLVGKDENWCLPNNNKKDKNEEGLYKKSCFNAFKTFIEGDNLLRRKKGDMASDLDISSIVGITLMVIGGMLVSIGLILCYTTKVWEINWKGLFNLSHMHLSNK